MNDKLSNEKVKTIKYAKNLMKEIKEVVQAYTNVMKYSDRKKLRKTDSKDIRDFILPKQGIIDEILKSVLDHVDDISEKRIVQRCIELNKTIKDHLNQLVKDDFDMEQINSEVITLFGYIARLVNSYE